MIGNVGRPGAAIGLFADRRWDDLSAPVAAARLDTVSGRLTYDYFNGGVRLEFNARYPEEPVLIPIQLPHSIAYGQDAVLKPHLHWLQEQSAQPNFLLAYKKIAQGTIITKETDFSNYTFLTAVGNAFAYTSGVLTQITMFPEIDISDLTISAQVNIVLFRDTANTSGLFSGVDPIAGPVIVTYQDQHVKFDSTGSRLEYEK